MPPRTVPRRATLALLAAVAATPARAQAQPPLVFAAASLREALDAAAAAWTRDSGTAVRSSYAASSALARQIEAGAPADLFLSADTAWMDYLDQRKLLRAGTRGDLLANRLVLIAPSGSPAALDIGPGMKLRDAVGDGRLAMADPETVPAGRYGKAALVSLGVWDAVRDRVAPTQDVRAALVLVARREAPLGIVYATDAAADPRVRVVGMFPASSHPQIVYPVAQLAASTAASAPALLAFLRSDATAAIFRKHGFAAAKGPA